MDPSTVHSSPMHVDINAFITHASMQASMLVISTYMSMNPFTLISINPWMQPNGVQRHYSYYWAWVQISLMPEFFQASHLKCL